MSSLASSVTIISAQSLVRFSSLISLNSRAAINCLIARYDFLLSVISSPVRVSQALPFLYSSNAASTEHQQPSTQSSYHLQKS